MQTHRAVHFGHHHKHIRGDGVDTKYAATYRIGKSTVHVVAPRPMTEEEKEAILSEYDRAFWLAWNSLTVEERLKINSMCSK